MVQAVAFKPVTDEEDQDRGQCAEADRAGERQPGRGGDDGELNNQDPEIDDDRHVDAAVLYVGIRRGRL